MFDWKSKKKDDYLTSVFDVVEHYGGFQERENEAPVIDWQTVAYGLIRDHLPEVEPEKRGRPPVDRSQLVKDVDALRESKKAKSIQHACDILQAKGKYPELDDLASAYKRARKKIKNSRA